MNSTMSAIGTALCRGVAPPLIFELAILQATLADHHAVRHADQFPVGEHRARPLAAVVEDDVDAGRLQRRIQARRSRP